MSSLTVDSPIGRLLISAEGEYITGVRLLRDGDCAPEDVPSPAVLECAKQLGEYFEGKRRSFDLLLRAEGTPFQQKVWTALRRIPYGETRTYGEIAADIGNSNACRAVGGANNKNPILIITPCHRVIGADGSLVGFGAGLDAKSYLLLSEQRR